MARAGNFMMAKFTKKLAENLISQGLNLQIFNQISKFKKVARQVKEFL